MNSNSLLSQKAIFVPQQKFIILNNKSNNKLIGSFGAGPCTILILYNKNYGTLCGHIDASVNNVFIEEKIINYLNKYIKNNDYSDLKIYFSMSGLEENKTLILKVIEILSKFIPNIDTKINYIESTQMILNLNTNRINTSFNPRNKFNINIKKNLNNLRNKLLSQLPKYSPELSIENQEKLGLNKYGRTSPPGLHYYWSSSNKSWRKI